MTDWIAIFKTGIHTDSNGNTKAWTEKDLDNIVSKYDPSDHEAPVVIGHPQNNTPAYGWVESLKREGQTLYMKMKDVIPAFADMVMQKMFKKRSISLYPDGTLRHVGWLGAAPPAIKGLPDFAFRDEGSAVTMEFMEDMHISTIRQVFQRIRDWIIEKEGGEQADKIINQWDLESLRNIESDDSVAAPAFAGQNKGKEEKAMKFFDWLKGLAAKEGVTIEDLPTAGPAFNDVDMQAKFDAAIKEKETEFSEKVASLDEARKKKEAELKAREDALKSQEKEGKKKNVQSFVEDLAKQGKIVPAMMKVGMGLQSFMEQISEIETPIEFGEGDEKKSQTPIEFMQSFLSALPKSIEFGEVAVRDKDVSGNASEKITSLTKKKMEENKKITYSQAFTEVQRENPDLAAEYAEDLKGGR